MTNFTVHEHKLGWYAVTDEQEYLNKDGVVYPSTRFTDVPDFINGYWSSEYRARQAVMKYNLAECNDEASKIPVETYNILIPKTQFEDLKFFEARDAFMKEHPEIGVCARNRSKKGLFTTVVDDLGIRATVKLHEKADSDSSVVGIYEAYVKLLKEKVRAYKMYAPFTVGDPIRFDELDPQELLYTSTGSPVVRPLCNT